MTATEAAGEEPKARASASNFAAGAGELAGSLLAGKAELGLLVVVVVVVVVDVEVEIEANAAVEMEVEVAVEALVAAVVVGAGEWCPGCQWGRRVGVDEGGSTCMAG